MKMHTENSFQIPHFGKSIIYYFLQDDKLSKPHFLNSEQNKSD